MSIFHPELLTGYIMIITNDSATQNENCSTIYMETYVKPNEIEPSLVRKQL